MADNRGMQISQPTPASVQANVPSAAVRGASPASAVSASADVAPPARPTADALVARLDAYGAGLSARLGEALAGAAPGDEPAFQDSLGRFEQSLGRIRAGIEDGSLRGDDLAGAVQGALRLVRADLEAVRGTTSPVAEAAAADAAAEVAESTGAEAPATTAPADAPGVSQGRFQSLVSGIGSRLAGLTASDSEATPDRLAELQAAEEAFTSAAARIETAFFENGDFDRGTFYGLFSASLGRLQQRVSDLFSGTQTNDATLYDPKRGVESLSDGLKKVRFDRTA